MHQSLIRFLNHHSAGLLGFQQGHARRAGGLCRETRHPLCRWGAICMARGTPSIREPDEAADGGQDCGQYLAKYSSPTSTHFDDMASAEGGRLFSPHCAELKLDRKSRRRNKKKPEKNKRIEESRFSFIRLEQRQDCKSSGRRRAWIFPVFDGSKNWLSSSSRTEAFTIQADLQVRSFQ